MVETSEKEMVPLVEAMPLVAEDDAGMESSVIIMEEGRDSKKMVSLVAPAGLPPGYRLPIQYREGGKSVSAFCRIPGGGVREGQEFEAEIIAPRAVLGMWATGSFDCGSMRDTAFTMLSCCCTAVAWGCLYESAFKKPSGSCWVVMLVLTVVYNVSYIVSTNKEMVEKGGKSHIEEGDVLSLIVAMLSWSLIIAVTCIRAKIRQKFQIVSDCVTSRFVWTTHEIFIT